MTATNRDVADKFDRLADLLEIDGANPFRIRAYRNAARVIGGLSAAVADLLQRDPELGGIPGIGKDLAGKIRTIVETGELPLLNEIAQRVPMALSDLMRLEGLGPKRVKELYESLHIDTVEGLRRAAESGQIRVLPGFGTKSEERILACLRRVATTAAARLPLAQAEAVAEPLVAYLRAIDGVRDVAIAGSYRRRKETVGDLDVLVTAARGTPVMQRFTAYGGVQEIVSQGTTRATVILPGGLHVDLRVVPAASYGAALHYFTGSQAHNIAVRTLGVKAGLKINEYGVFRGDTRIAGRTEREVYRCVGLPYIEPELREDRGEMAAARDGSLPSLVKLADVRGDLHCHTSASDGADTLAAMAQAARALGYEYLAVTDHSPARTEANGLDRGRLLRQLREIDRLNERLAPFRILKAAEVDILPDGGLDLPDELLGLLDVRVCAVHADLALPAPRQTARLLRAMENPYCNILAHPTGRLDGEHRGFEIDIARIMDAARTCGVFLELNAQSKRMDLSDDACLAAKRAGVRVAVSTDAHSAADLRRMRYGIDQARRGWLEKRDVINTLPLSRLLRVFQRA